MIACLFIKKVKNMLSSKNTHEDAKRLMEVNQGVTEMNKRIDRFENAVFEPGSRSAESRLISNFIVLTLFIP